MSEEARNGERPKLDFPSAAARRATNSSRVCAAPPARFTAQASPRPCKLSLDRGPWGGEEGLCGQAASGLTVNSGEDGPVSGRHGEGFGETLRPVFRWWARGVYIENNILSIYQGG